MDNQLPFKIKGLDHIALTVENLEASVNFYHKLLGLELLNYAEYKAGTRSFLSVRLGQTLIDLFPSKSGPSDSSFRPNCRLNHFCLYLETDLDWIEFKAHIQNSGIEIKNEIKDNWGSFGYGNSIYIQEPDGNSVELKNY